MSDEEESFTAADLPAEVFSLVLSHVSIVEVCAARPLCTKIQSSIDYWHAQELCEDALRMARPMVHSMEDFLPGGNSLKRYVIGGIDALGLKSASAAAPSSGSSKISRGNVKDSSGNVFARFIECTHCASYFLRILLFNSFSPSHDGIFFDWSEPMTQCLLSDPLIFRQLQKHLKDSPFLHPENVEHLQLDHCPHEDALLGVLDYIRELKKLNPKFKPLRKISIASMSGPMDTAMYTIMTKSKRYASSLQCIDAANTGINDQCLELIAVNCPNFRELKISGVSGVTDHGISEIAKRCHQLQALDISFTNGRITWRSIEDIANQCPELQSLNVQGTNCMMTHDVICDVAKNCKKLRELYLGREMSTVEWFTDSTVQSIAENCSKITHLDVSCNVDITNAGLAFIADGCPELCYLNVSHCTDVSDYGIVAIAEHCSALKYILVQKTKIGDKGLQAVAMSCPELVYLDVSFTSCQITDKVIQTVAKHSSNLQVLNVAGQTKLTDSSIIQIVKNCKKLKALDVSRLMANVTDETVEALCKTGSLDFLLLRKKFTAITDDALVTLVASCPMVQIEPSSASLGVKKNVWKWSPKI